MDTNKIRSFFAIPVSIDCRQEINKVVLGLKEELSSNIRWVNMENLHLTLKFLGEFKSVDVPRIENTLRSVLSTSKRFKLTFQNLGVFLNQQKPKVIWIGIKYPVELMHLFQKLEIATLDLGYPKEERGFSPHLTIGRVKNDALDLSKIGVVIKNKRVGEICSSHVDGIIFLQSILTPTGSVYSELFNIPFRQ